MLKAGPTSVRAMVAALELGSKLVHGIVSNLRKQGFVVDVEDAPASSYVDSVGRRRSDRLITWHNGGRARPQASRPAPSPRRAAASSCPEASPRIRGYRWPGVAGVWLGE